MPRFLSKPKVIEAIRVGFDEIPPGVRIETEGGVYRVWNELHQSWINFKHGDSVRVDVPGDHYPIDVKYMEENYNFYEEDR